MRFFNAIFASLFLTFLVVGCSGSPNVQAPAYDVNACFGASGQMSPNCCDGSHNPKVPLPTGCPSDRPGQVGQEASLANAADRARGADAVINAARDLENGGKPLPSGTPSTSVGQAALATMDNGKSDSGELGSGPGDQSGSRGFGGFGGFGRKGSGFGSDSGSQNSSGGTLNGNSIGLQLNPTNAAAPHATPFAMISETGSAYSGGGAAAAAGGGFTGLGGFESGSGQGQAAYLTESYGRSPSGDVSPVGSADPEDYFTRLGLGESIFKVVERKYREKSTQWVQSDLQVRPKTLKAR